MKFFENLLNINIWKLFVNGKIDQLYERMYNTAHNLAAEETRKNMDLISRKLKRNKKLVDGDYANEIIIKMLEFKNQRIQHHMNEMQKLLKLREQSNKQ